MKNYASPVLYKVDQSGALRQWQSWSEGNVVHTKFGQVDGKMQQSMDIVKGKGVGKASTTPEQQAAREAEGLADKQIKKGYSVTRKKAESTTNALPAFLPMLAATYEDVKNPVYPAYFQAKLDGLRALAIYANEKCVLYSRSQKLITTVPHINKAVEVLAEKNGLNSFTLDGEFYTHSCAEDFGKILGAIKRKEIGEDSELVQYWIYDLPSDDPFSIRTESLASLLHGAQPPLILVETVKIENESAAYAYAKKCVNEKFEGAMYRASSGIYEGKRSKGLLKMKTMSDAEFVVIGFKAGTGKLQGLVGSWECRTKDGIEFNAKMEGKLELLPTLEEGRKFIGKQLVVRYQGLTPDGSLRFPVGVRFCDELEK